MMKSRFGRFNIYLLALVTAALTGCETTRSSVSKKEASTFRVHLEMKQGPPGRCAVVTVYRDRPLQVSLDTLPFLSELNVEKAEVIGTPDGFAIQVQLNREGTWLLEGASVSNRSKRIGIKTQFTEERWLAAPILSRHISDGLLVFKPDATLEEAQRIVRGLNNMVKEIKKKGS